MSTYYRIQTRNGSPTTNSLSFNGNSISNEFMLDYLVSLLDDARDFSWEAAKASHAMLLCGTEQRDVKNYSQIEKIDRIRRANAQRHIHPTNQFHKKS